LKNKVRKAYLLADKKQTPLPRVQGHDESIDLHTLELQLPARAPGKHVSVVVLEVSGEPEMDQGLLQAPDGQVLLEASNGETSQGRGGRALAEGRFGTVEGWSSKQQALSWTLKLAKGGDFDVEVVSQTERTGGWGGGHKVKLASGRRSVQGQLREDARELNPRAPVHLQDVVSKVGRITLARPGTTQLVLRMEQLPKRKDTTLKVRGIRLTPAS